MARRVYTDRDRAMVAMMLQAEESLRSISRNTGIPFTTVKEWKDKWLREGYPANLEEALPALRQEFTEEATNLRWLMVEKLREKVEKNDISAAQLVAGIGMLTDKINVLRGLATSRTETVHTNAPDPAEFAKELAAFVADTVDAANKRHEEIEDAEIVEEAPKLVALPPA